jgi:Cu(I)/Ag(I) efflux system membrane protein CusA/SilA
MIERIIEFSIRNRFLVFAGTVALILAGAYCVWRTPVDAIPDLSENQLIVFADWMGHSAQEIEDQVTYPLATQLQALAGIQAVRSESQFNFSMITLIFNEQTDFYFARQRVLERLASLGDTLPAGVNAYLAPDGTATGQIFWYTVESDEHDLAQLRSLQDWYIRRALASVEGVAEVASIGGFPIEYQVDVDPYRLQAYGVTLAQLQAALARSNAATGARTVEKAGAEFIVRSVGWLETLEDIENTVVAQRDGVPIYVKHVASVQRGTAFRRGVLEKGGREAVGGVVLMRYGENPLEVTQRLKDKILDIQPGLPRGVRIVPFYDRTPLILGAIGTVSGILLEAMLTATVMILLILGHLRSSAVICLSLPLAILFSFVLMYLLGVQSNIMSLAGLAISIGVLVDSSIVMVENASHHLAHRFGGQRIVGDTREDILRACRTVGRPIFFSIIIMLISFLPVFALSGMEGRMFRPLAWTKSLAMIGVAVLAITLVPALLPTFLRGRIRREEDNRIVWGFIQVYRPMLAWFLRHPNLCMWVLAGLCIAALGLAPMPAAAYLLAVLLVLGVATYFTMGLAWQCATYVTLLLLAIVAWHFPKQGREFMPPLDEGTILDMATSIPRASLTQVVGDLKARDSILRQFPEIALVVGKAGRADSPLDPAPLEMFETLVDFEPRRRWPKRHLRYDDARRQVDAAYELLVERGIVQPYDDVRLRTAGLAGAGATLKPLALGAAPLLGGGALPAGLVPQAAAVPALAEALRRAPDAASRRDTLLNDATMTALAQTDQALREKISFELGQYREQLGRQLTRAAVDELLALLQRQGTLDERPPAEQLDGWFDAWSKQYGPLLAAQAMPYDLARLASDVYARLLEARRVPDDPDALQLRPRGVQHVTWRLREALGGRRPRLEIHLHDLVVAQRQRLLAAKIEELNWPVFDYAAVTFHRAAVHDLIQRAAHEHVLLREPAPDELPAILQQLAQGFADQVLLWPKTKPDIMNELESVLQVPGYGNVFTRPIQNRVDMLSTGARTQVVAKVFGHDLRVLQEVSQEVAAVLKEVPGAVGVVPEQSTGKPYIEIRMTPEKRRAAARYGVSVADIQQTIEAALGGEALTTLIAGRERYVLRVRYARDFRADEQDIRRLLVPAMLAPGSMSGSPAMSSGGMSGGGMSSAVSTPPSNAAMSRGGMTAAPPEGNSAGLPLAHVPLEEVAEVVVVGDGPAMIRSENGMLRNYVMCNVSPDRDVVGFVEEARRTVAQRVTLPPHVFIEWGGQFEHEVRATGTLLVILPLVVALIFLILYLTYHDMADALLMLLAVPGAMAGGVLFQWLFGLMREAGPVHFSVAVWVGYIACLGMATETGVVMLVYLREAVANAGGLQRIRSVEELRQAVMTGAVHRLRPKLLTEATTIISITPFLWASGVGSEVIGPMAAPVLGGLLVADEVIDVFLPVFFFWVRKRRWQRLHATTSESLPADATRVPQAAPAVS